MNYTQLTRAQRYQISILLKAGHNQTEIAILVACHKSTISRELRRNRGQQGYYPAQANKLARQRHRAAYQPRITPETWQQVELLLSQQWSPEQIAGWLRRKRQPTVSHERIYLYVYADSDAVACY